jgi:hypothetical protein
MRFSLSILAVFALAGCSAAVSPWATTDDPHTVQSALDAPNGDLTTRNEQPAFNDPAVQAIEGFTAEGADTQDLTLEAAKVQGVQSYHVAVIWGHLPPAHDADPSDLAPTIMDWTGSVSVSAGAIGVDRVIRFDYGDRLLARQDAQTVGFISHTLPHVDGLYLHVVIPPNATPSLHFATKSLTTDLDLGGLGKEPGGVVTLQDGRNGLFYVGFRDDGCTRGLLFGRWHKLVPSVGMFRGVVSNAHGDRIGNVRGIWGHAPKRNANVFFGKYIDNDGDHRGLFGGEYGAGRFAGVWGTVDPNDVGTLEGYYSDGYERGDGRGVFVGRWSENCPK